MIKDNLTALKDLTTHDLTSKYNLSPNSANLLDNFNFVHTCRVF